MAKTDTDFFNPNAIAQDFAFQSEKFNLYFKLKRALYPKNTLERYVDFDKINLDAMKTREASILKLVENVQTDFITKLNKAKELIANADPKGIIDKVYNRTPLMPKVEYKIDTEPTEGHGLNITNKLGGIPDLRRHWAMSYRIVDEKERSVEEMVKKLWPKNPDGEFLSCYGTVDLGIYMYLLSQVTRAPSTFAYHPNLMYSLNGDIAMFAPWCPGFDNRLDACIIKLEKDTHGISEEEYLQALENLGIFNGEPDYHDEQELKPTCYHAVTNPMVSFDLELYSGDYGDAPTTISKKHLSALYDIRDALEDWDNRDNPDNPFASQYPGLTFGGAPTSQQTPRRFMDINPYPTPCRMTPFVGFSHPVADVNYQIYTPRWPAPQSCETTFYGKVDSSCT